MSKQSKKVFLISLLHFWGVVAFCAVWGLFAYNSLVYAADSSCSCEQVLKAGSSLDALRILKVCPRNPCLMHAMGVRLIRENDNKSALPWIREAAMSEPDNPDYFQDYVVLLVWLGKYNMALNLFKNMPKSFPRRPYLLRNVAMAAAKTKRLELAVRLYKETLEKDPSDREAFEGLFYSLLSLRRFNKARHLLDQYVGTNGIKGFDTTFLRFRLYLAENRPIDGFRLWKRKPGPMCNDYFHEWKTYLKGLDIKEAEGLSKSLEELKAPIFDVFLPLALTRQYKKAMELVDGQKTGFWRSWPACYLSELAWVFFKNENIGTALKLYQTVLKAFPNDKDALIGKIYCLVKEKRVKEAENILTLLSRKYSRDIDVLFAKAFFYEGQRRFLKAIEAYDEILKFYPGNRWAEEAEIKAFSEMGLPSFAMDMAKAQKAPAALLDDLLLDEAALFQRWGRAKEAEKIYQNELGLNPQNQRAHLDYLLDLREQNRFPEVMEKCRDLFSKGKAASLPFWAKSPCADAYLYYDDPETALHIYDDILSVRPGDFNAALGRLYCLTALRRWDEAKKLAQMLFDKEPPGRMIGKKFYPNWRKVAVAIARGYIISETRPLEEAEEYFTDLKFKAPAHSGIGAALGDVYLWRGWPRKASQELKIAANKDPKEKDARVSLAYAMNDLGYEKEARALNKRLLKRFPYNKHVVNQKKLFDVQDMKEFVLDFSSDDEDADSTGYDLRAEINEKPFLNWRIYQYYLWQYSSFGDRSASFQRIGAGLRHRFGSDIYWQQEISLGIEGDENLGIGTSLSCTPDDFWKLSGHYTTYSTETPLRARAAGIDSDEASLGIAYRFSEWQSIAGNLVFMNFSDGNDRLAASISVRRGLWKNGDWLSEITVDNYLSFNSKDPKKVDYWNPRADWSCSLTHKLQYTKWRSFEQATIHRLFLTGGSYYQRDYGTKFIGSAVYEFDEQTSLRTHLLFRAGLARRVYDGDVTTALNFSVHFSYRF